MAEKITLFEIHAHTDGSSLNLEPSLGSGVGSLVSSALRSSGTTDEEDDNVVESLASSEDDDQDLLEDDFDEDDTDEDADDGAGKGTGLVGLLALVAFVFLARNLLGEDDEDDPFEEEFGQ